MDRLRQSTATLHRLGLGERTQVAVAEMERLTALVDATQAEEWKRIQAAQAEEWAHTEAAQAHEWSRIRARSDVEWGRNPPHCAACGSFTVMRDADGHCYSCRLQRRATSR